jgi:hypothetical protein
MDFQEAEFDSINQIYLAEDWDQCQALVNMVMKLQVQ